MTAPVVLSIMIPGVPVAKGRPRFARSTGRAYTPAKTATAEAHMRQAMIAQVGQPMLEGPLDIDVLCTMPVPASWSKRKRADAFAGIVRPTSRPDLENMLKGLLDAGNAILWVDDSQVCGIAAGKRYGERPGIHLIVRGAAA